MTGADTSTSKKQPKRRRMKQMEGLMMIARPKVDDLVSADGHEGKMRPIKPKRVHVMLQPQQLQLAYSAQEDQEMSEILGRIDLEGAKLEQAPDGFVIHANRPGKKFKLLDKDKAAIDAWFYAVYAAITEFTRPSVQVETGDDMVFSAALTSSLRDEATDGLEFELSCQLVIPSRSLDEQSIRWKVWKTAAEIQMFDESLHAISSLVPYLVGTVFPRERKRDSLFGGLRKKFVQELRQQQLALYIEKLFSIYEVSTNPESAVIVRTFLRLDAFFDIQPHSDPETDNQESGDTTHEEHATFDDNSHEAYHHHHHSHTHHQVAFEEPEAVVEEPFSYKHEQMHLSQLDSTDVVEEIVEVVPETDPAMAKKLHKEIIGIVRELVNGDEDRVREFQDQTKDFGRGRTEANEYCAFLHGAVGAKQCIDLIPKMARLLPDDEKRQELLSARAAIVKRKQRQNRRRSKQFSESIALQQYRFQQEMSLPPIRSKVRPKSDTFTAMNHASQEQPTGWPRTQEVPVSWQRNSTVEPRTLSRAQSTSSSEEDWSRRSLPDARRKLRSRGSSLNLFGEFVPNEPIEEERNPAAWDSEDNNDEHSSDGVDFEAAETVPAEVKSLPPVFRRLASFEGGSHGLPPPRSLDPSYGQRVRTEKTNSGRYNGEDGESGQQDQVEDNPVLARLKKQGAVNFMLR